MDAPPKLLTARELAPLVGVTAQTLYRMARRGTIPCHALGRQVRFDLQAVLAATREAPDTPSPIQALAAQDVRRALAGKGGRR